jgi:hypothetical protein
MTKEQKITKLANELFYRDLAREHQFWYSEEDRPLLEKCKEKEFYYSDARKLLRAIEPNLHLVK